MALPSNEWRCNGTLMSHESLRCSYRGTLEHEGKLYCKRHHKPTVVAKNREEYARWRREWKQKDRVREAERRLDEARRVLVAHIRNINVECLPPSLLGLVEDLEQAQAEYDVATSDAGGEE